MAVSYEQARAACVAHYAKRVMDAEYWNRILPTDPVEVFRIYGEIQKEIEDSKRIQTKEEKVKRYPSVNLPSFVRRCSW